MTRPAGNHLGKVYTGTLIIGALLTGLGALAGVSAEPTPHYPKHRLVDYEHMLLDITIPDMNTPVMEVTQTLRFSPISQAVTAINLDAKLLDITSVEVEGYETSFENMGESLRVTFEPAIELGEHVEMVTVYTVNDPPHGLNWTLTSPGWPDRPPQIHTQGETDTNSYWFPNHDYPNERLTTELIVNVPAGFLVSSNGKLIERSRAVGSVPNPAGGRRLAGREVFHWLQDKPHVNYLVSLIVGKFDVVDVGTPELSMPVYVPPGRGGDVQDTYGRTAEMVSFFEDLFDEPYPWDRYAQLLVWNFSAGGMENTSATTLYDTAIFDRKSLIDNDLDGLIAHELGHQWFGDLLTCNDWKDLWLNEGFATYLDALWQEHRDGRDAYMRDMLKNFDRVIARDKAVWPEQQSMVSNVFENPGDMFGRPANPYPKGASILHMLRQRLGDEVFFQGVGEYVERHKFQTVETSQLRVALEEVSGESLDQFFRQWVRRPGVPHISATVDYAGADATLNVDLQQTQNIDSDNPAFAFDLPILVVGEGADEREVFYVSMNSRSVNESFSLAFEPWMIVIDPELTVLASISPKMSTAYLIRQAQDGPTLSSRIRAVRNLGKMDDEITASVLGQLARTSGEIDVLRAEAVKALGKRNDVRWIHRLMNLEIAEYRVREAVIKAMGNQLGDGLPDGVVLDLDAVGDRLSSIYFGDLSQRVRSEAVRAMGHLGSDKALGVVLHASKEPSQHDRIKQAALDAFVSLDVPEGLSFAIEMSQDGHLDRPRSKAIRTIVKLSHHDESRAFDALLSALGARQRRAWVAAGGALVELKDQGALEALQTLHDTLRANDDQDRVQTWIEKLSENPAEDSAEEQADADS